MHANLMFCGDYTLIFVCSRCSFFRNDVSDILVLLSRYSRSELSAFGVLFADVNALAAFGEVIIKGYVFERSTISDPEAAVCLRDISKSFPRYTF